MKRNYRIGAIIFSRFDSHRLFGKALIDIQGRSLLGRVIDRAKLIKGLNKIIVATSNREIDNQICEFVESEGLETFRGSCNDVYGRAIETCDKFNLDFFARICGDRPFFDFDLISKAIKISQEYNHDLVTTMYPRTYPPGLTTEIIKTDLLRNYDNQVSNPFDREHLTTYFYENPENIKIKNLKNPYFEKIKNVSLVVDTFDDLKKATWIAKHKKDIGETDELDSILSLALNYSKQN